MEVKLISYTNNPVETIEAAASNCYDTKIETLGKLMNQCYNSGHTSILEHASFTFQIDEVSRALLAQLTRHRIASYSVRSQRYCSESNFEFYTPQQILNDEKTNNKYKKIMKEIQNSYDELAELIPNEDARNVLPNACHTSLTFTINLRSLINFMHERMCTRAQSEIRQLARYIKVELEFLELELYGKQIFTQFLVPKCQANKVHFCVEHKCCGLSKKIEDILKGGDQ